MKKIISIGLVIIFVCLTLCSCELTGAQEDTLRTIEAGNRLQSNQETPTDIEYSLERYNLIRRTYWVNGQREKAISLPCEIEKPLGYIVLFAGNAAVERFVVDGKVTSLNSFLTPDSEYYQSPGSASNHWLPDVDGSYGENDDLEAVTLERLG